MNKIGHLQMLTKNGFLSALMYFWKIQQIYFQFLNWTCERLRNTYYTMCCNFVVAEKTNSLLLNLSHKYHSIYDSIIIII